MYGLADTFEDTVSIEADVVDGDVKPCCPEEAGEAVSEGSMPTRRVRGGALHNEANIGPERSRGGDFMNLYMWW